MPLSSFRLHKYQIFLFDFFELNRNQDILESAYFQNDELLLDSLFVFVSH